MWPFNRLSKRASDLQEVLDDFDKARQELSDCIMEYRANLNPRKVNKPNGLDGHQNPFIFKQG